MVTKPVSGQAGWDVPLNAALDGLQNQINGNGANIAANAADITLLKGQVSNVKLPPYNAKGDGVTDDTTAIQTALNACPAGGIVYLPAGMYATSAPLTIPPEVTLMGSHGGHIDNLNAPTLKPLASFAGAAVLLLLDQATGGYTRTSLEQRIERLSIDGSNLTGSTIDGIQAQGYVHGVYLTDLQIRNVPNHGIATVSNVSGAAYSWRGTRVHVSNTGGNGLSASMTDSTWIDCQAIGAGGHGWFIGGAANSQFIGCRSEWSAFDGYNFGSTGTGAGSGGPTLIGCTTDRNGQSGIDIPAAASGNGPVTIVGCTLRRDGRTSTSSGYAGINVNGAAEPVVITGVSVYPGTDDDGTGNNSPQYGLAVTNATSVSYSACHLHAASAGFFDGGGNTRVGRGINVTERTGTTSSPTTVTRGVQTYGATGDSLDVPGHLSGNAQPRSHGAAAWTFDPAIIGSGKAGTAQTLYLAALYIPRPLTATKLFWGISSATTGSGATAGQNFVGLYDATGARLASVGVDARIGTSGLFTETISTAITPGQYWVAFLINATTMPAIYRGGDQNATLINFNLGAPAMRYATNGTGLTALPATITPASNVAAQFSYFAAIG